MSHQHLSSQSPVNADTLPLLDLSLLNGSETERQAFLDALRHAARDIGFFYLTGHGIDPALLQQIQTLSREFFALPDEEKLAVVMVRSPHFRGYNRAASELTRGQPDWREQFDIGAERTPLPQTSGTPSWARLQGPNQWPEALPELKPTLLQWQREMTGMALRLLRAFALSLNLDENAFDELYGDKPNEHIKLIRYPGRETTQSGQGVGAHKDSGFLSFYCKTSNAACRSKWKRGAGLMPCHGRIPLWSISVNCWSWPVMVICVPRYIGSKPHRRGLTAYRLPFSSVPVWMQWFRCIH